MGAPNCLADPEYWSVIAVTTGDRSVAGWLTRKNGRNRVHLYDNCGFEFEDFHDQVKASRCLHLKLRTMHGIGQTGRELAL